MLAGPLPSLYDPTAPGKLLFAFFAAMAETERASICESTLDARKGKHGGRPPETSRATGLQDPALRACARSEHCSGASRLRTQEPVSPNC
ncbi:hypothetical protein [Streptomyces sp. NPDC057287]|uniref:hypothetical protein n=1 Tax=Streptomyces sp. NPDC057287 TaxID=3346086 RepID=UPI0036327FB1